MPSTTQSTVIQLPDTVAIGGTGMASATAYSPIAGGTTTTGSLQSASTGQSSAGYVLTSTGSSSLPTFQAAASTAPYLLLQTQTASNSASIIFNSTYITSTYSSYYFVWSNAVPAVASSFELLVSTNNGGVWIATGYQSGLISVSYNSATWSNLNSTTYIILSGGATALVSGWCLLQNVTNGAAFQCNGMATNINSSGTTVFHDIFATNTATSVNAIKFISGGGNITSGTFSLYGIAK